MDKKIIEKKGIDAVSDYICNTGLMYPHLSDNDKTPLWDGEIFVYKKKNKLANKTFDFTVPVQIKSHEFPENEVFPEQTSYSISVTDLKNYFSDGGLVFFYVYVKQYESQIYCSFLTNIKIKKLLDNIQNAKSKSIQMDKIPQKLIDFREQLRIIHLQRTHSVVDLDTIDVNNIRTLTFIVDREDPTTSQIQTLTQNHVNILVDVKGFDKSLYASGQPAKVQLLNSEDVNVSVNGKVYFRHLNTEMKEDGSHLLFGKSIEVILPYENKAGETVHMNIDLKCTSIDEIINEIEFILAFVKTEKIKIGKKCLELKHLSDESSSVAPLKDRLLFWKNVKKVFKQLHVRGNLNPMQISEKDYNNLNTLITSFVFKEPISNQDIAERVYTLAIAGLHIFVYAKKENGKIRLYDIYENLQSCYKDENKLNRGAPMLSFVCSQKNLPSNLFLDNAIGEYKKYIEYNDQILLRANEDLLKILNHYDKINDPYLIDNALTIAKWLKKQKSNDSIETIIYELNYYQTIYRKKGGLNKAEQNKLQKMKIEDDMCNFGRYALLGNIEKAYCFLGKLPKENIDYIKQMPIYIFMNK